MSSDRTPKPAPPPDTHRVQYTVLPFLLVFLFSVCALYAIFEERGTGEGVAKEDDRKKPGRPPKYSPTPCE